MFRSLIALSALAIVLAAPAAPAPKTTEAVYYPTQVGTECVYLYGNSEFALVVTAVEEKNGEKVVTVASKQVKASDLHPHETVSVSHRGLFLRSSSGTPLDPPICLLKFPYEKGQQWTINTSYPTFKTKGKCAAHGPERIVVPAGTFDAIRVESESQVEGGELRRTTTWYAEGVGLVKMVSKADGNPKEVVLVLKSSSPRK